MSGTHAKHAWTALKCFATRAEVTQPQRGGITRRIFLPSCQGFVWEQWQMAWFNWNRVVIWEKNGGRGRLVNWWEDVGLGSIQDWLAAGSGKMPLELGAWVLTTHRSSAPKWLAVAPSYGREHHFSQWISLWWFLGHVFKWHIQLPISTAAVLLQLLVFSCIILSSEFDWLSLLFLLLQPFAHWFSRFSFLE